MSAAINRIADRIDLALDLLTLGQYGLEQAPAGGACREGSGLRADWEALPSAPTACGAARRHPRRLTA